MSRGLVAVVAMLVVLAGCGSVENDPNLAAAIAKTEDAGSSRIAMDVTETDEGEIAELTCDGKSDSERSRLQISCTQDDVSAFELIAIGTRSYVRGDLVGIGGAGSKWVQTDDAEVLGDSFSPQRLLEMLRHAATETRRIGDEVVRDVDTVRYRLDVQCEQAELVCDGATAPVEVWIGEDGLVRRIAFEDSSAAGTIEFFDFGAEVVIEAPPPGEILSSGSFDPKPCPNDYGAPISVVRALGALQGAGFDVSEAECTGALAVLGTELAGGQGYVSCFLRAKPPRDAPTTVRRRGADGGDAELELHNLSCTIVTDSPTGEGTIDKLEAAFEELELAVGS